MLKMQCESARLRRVVKGLLLLNNRFPQQVREWQYQFG